MKNEPLIIRRSDQPLDAICARLPEIAQKHQFGVLGEHNLRQKMESKGIAFARECRVFEVCNPQQAKVVLENAMEISTALPCRIAVYSEGGKTVLATIKPSVLFGFFDAPDAASVAQEVESAMTKIMEETATSGS